MHKPKLTKIKGNQVRTMMNALLEYMVLYNIAIFFTFFIMRKLNSCIGMLII